MAETLLTLTTNNAGAGVATVTGFTELALRGYLEAIQMVSYGAAPGTTTVTITEEDTGRSILAIPAGNTAHVSYVRAPTVNLSDAAIASSWTNIYLSTHRLQVVVALANSANVLTFRFFWSDIG